MTGGEDGKVLLWDVDSGAMVDTWPGKATTVRLGGRCNSVAFSPDGAKVVVASGLYKEQVRAAVFSTDGRKVITGSKQKSTRLWDSQTRRLMHSFEGHSDSVEFVACSPAGDRVATASLDNSVRIWDVNTARPVATFSDNRVNAVAFAPDGRHVVIGLNDGTAAIWERA